MKGVDEQLPNFHVFVLDQTYKMFSLGASKITSGSEMTVCCQYKSCVKDK